MAAAADGRTPEPGILVLRVEGPTAIEIQHLSGVMLERVNRFFGWQAVGALRLRQAPLAPASKSHPAPGPIPEATARIAADAHRDRGRQSARCAGPAGRGHQTVVTAP